MNKIALLLLVSALALMLGGAQAWVANASDQIYALRELIQENQVRVPYPFPINVATYVNVLERTFPVLPGDVLRIRSQVETTVDPSCKEKKCKQAVRMHLRIVANNKDISYHTSQNNNPFSHHMPNWVDAEYLVGEERQVTLGVQLLAKRNLPVTSHVKVESGYTYLIVELFRPYPTLQDAVADNTLFLSQIVTTDQTQIQAFGHREPYVSRFPFKLEIDVREGDLLYLWSQSTATYSGMKNKKDDNDMHGQGLYVLDHPNESSANISRAISPFSTENVPWNVNSVPLYLSDVDPIFDEERRRVYAVGVHGVTGLGLKVPENSGHLYAIKYSPFSRGLGLHSYGGTSVLKSNSFKVQANQGWTSFLQKALFLEANQIVRATAAIQLQMPSNYPLGIACTTYLMIQDERQNPTYSSASTKYLAPILEVIPLRNELLFTANERGLYWFTVQIACSRENDHPMVQIMDEGTALLLDVFKPI